MTYLNLKVAKDIVNKFVQQKDLTFLFINAKSGAGKTHFIKYYLKEDLLAMQVSMPSTGKLKDLYYAILHQVGYPIDKKIKLSELQLSHTVELVLKNLKLIMVDDSQNLFQSRYHEHILESLNCLAESTSTKFIFLGTSIPSMPFAIRRRSRMFDHAAAM